MFFCIDIWIGAGGESPEVLVCSSQQVILCGAALKAELEGLSATQLREGGETQTNQGQFCQVTGRQNGTFNLITALGCGRYHFSSQLYHGS